MTRCTSHSQKHEGEAWLQRAPGFDRRKPDGSRSVPENLADEKHRYAITYLHRSQVFYRAYKDQPTNVNVQAVRARGLQNVRMVVSWAPAKLVRRMGGTHNKYHKGSSASFLELAEHAMALAGGWQAHCFKKGIVSQNNPNYKVWCKACLRHACV